MYGCQDPKHEEKDCWAHTSVKEKIITAPHSYPKEKAGKPAEGEGLFAFMRLEKAPQTPVCFGSGRQAAHRDDAVTVLHPSIPGAQPDALFPELGAHTGL